MIRLFLHNSKRLFLGHGSNFSFAIISMMVVFYVTLLPNGLYFWNLFCIASLFFMPWRRYLDRCGKWIAVWSISFSLMLLYTHGAYSGISIVLYFISPFIFYSWGGRIVDKLYNEEQIIYFLFYSILCISFFVFKQNIYNYHVAPTIIDGERSFIFDGQGDIAVTLIGLLITPTIVGLPYFVALRNQVKNPIAWLFMLLTFMGLFATFRMVNRTALVIFVIVLFVAIIYRTRANIFKIILLSVVAAGCILFAVKFFVGQDIIAAYAARMLDEDELMTGGTRTTRWLDAITRMFYMPFGWYGNAEWLTGYDYVHNWWLDVGRQTGLFPFITLLVPTIKSLLNALKLFKLRDNALAVLLVLLNVALFLGCMMEPVMEGCAPVAYFYIFIWGIQNRYVRSLKQRAILK